MLLTPAQIKPKSFESRRNTLFLFLPEVDAPHVYVRAWALGCFHSLISTRTFRRAPTASVASRARDKECPFSGVTKSGRVWRKVSESDARSVRQHLTLHRHHQNRHHQDRAQVLCESRGGRPGLSSLINLRFLWT